MTDIPGVETTNQDLSTSNLIYEVFLSVTISLFIILKIVELVLKQINQNKNYNQQNEKINLMSVNSSMSEEEMTKKIFEAVKTIKPT